MPSSHEGPGRRSLARRILVAGFKIAAACALLLVLLALAGKVVTPPSTLMLARWATGQPVERIAVPLASISPFLPLAVIGAEDAQYCAHRGVDWTALRDVIDDEDGPRRGASTIAMQSAKNVFLWPSRSYIRKGMEIPLALGLDLVWGKRRVMEVYLNVAEWGEGVFGAEAAARRHFGKPARDLTRREAALLAASLPNPRARDPAHPSAAHRRRAETVLARAAPSLAVCLTEP